MKKLSKMTMILFGICTILAVEGTLFPSYVAFAQSVRGSLAGSVMDQSGQASQVRRSQLGIRTPVPCGRLSRAVKAPIVFLS